MSWINPTSNEELLTNAKRFLEAVGVSGIPVEVGDHPEDDNGLNVTMDGRFSIYQQVLANEKQWVVDVALPFEDRDSGPNVDVATIATNKSLFWALSSVCIAIIHDRISKFNEDLAEEVQREILTGT